MAEAVVVKFCTHVGYVKSQHKHDKSGLIDPMWPIEWHHCQFP